MTLEPASKTSVGVLRSVAFGIAFSTVGVPADIDRERSPSVERIVPREAAPSTKPERPEVEFSRGQLLYENHCRGCHQSVVHVREGRKAESPAAVDAWVRRWSDTLKLGWTGDEVAAVSRYLTRRFYKFDGKR